MLNKITLGQRRKRCKSYSGHTKEQKECGEEPPISQQEKCADSSETRFAHKGKGRGNRHKVRLTGNAIVNFSNSLPDDEYEELYVGKGRGKGKKVNKRVDDLPERAQAVA